MAETKKTMDVSKPGSSSPDDSSRPIVVSHKPEVQDPMVKSEDGGKKSTPAPEPMAARSSKVIQPLTEQSHEELGADPKEKEATVEQKEASKAAAVVDAVAEQTDLGNKNDKERIDDEQTKKLEAYAKLVEEKKYFVPVGQVAHRRNRRAMIILVALLLLVAAAYLAIDAGLIDVGVDVPVHIMPN